jgi:hypothetical protein
MLGGFEIKTGTLGWQSGPRLSWGKGGGFVPVWYVIVCKDRIETIKPDQEVADII